MAREVLSFKSLVSLENYEIKIMLFLVECVSLPWDPLIKINGIHLGYFGY